MKTEHLGKINSLKIGFGGYQDICFGIHINFTVSVDGHSVGYCWSKDAVMSEVSVKGILETALGEVFSFLSVTMRHAKITDASKFVGIPVMLECEDDALIAWRVLTEVL